MRHKCNSDSSDHLLSSGSLREKAMPDHFQSIGRDLITLYKYDVSIIELARALQIRVERFVEIFKDSDSFEFYARHFAARMLGYGVEKGFWNLRSDLVDVTGKNKERRIAVRYLSDNTTSTFTRHISTEPFETLANYKVRVPGPVHAYLFVDVRQLPTLTAWEIPSRKVSEAVNAGYLGARGVTAAKIDGYREKYFTVDHVVRVTMNCPRNHFTILPTDFSELEERYATFG